MQLIRYILAGFYRLWFYFIVLTPILLLFPLLVLSILKASWYPFFFKLARLWATFILFGMGYVPKIKRQEIYKKNTSYMFVSNHTSMTDIMLMLYVVRNPFVFVGKAELAKLPLFGFFYKRTCILVDRSSPKSRRDVFNQAQQRLNSGLSICIFPEGGVPHDTSIVLDTFKDGAFRLAIDHHIAIAPMTFHDNKKRLPFHFFKGMPGKMRVVVHPTISTEKITLENRRLLREQTREVIWKELKNPSL